MAPMETMAATMSTSDGPKKLETTNCGMAKKRPATRQAGHTSTIPRKPDMAHTSQKGTMIEKNGSCRPTMEESAISFRPVTLASVMMGVPSAPKATGAVFPMRARPAAASGLKPSPMSIAAEMATGVPKPAAPSMKAPKAKPMSSTWMRRSAAIPAMVSFTTSNFPVLTVMS
jgi:hypothetical protein